MTYTVEQLAPGSYDVLRDGVVMAALVRLISSSRLSDMWQIELLDEMTRRCRKNPRYTDPWHTLLR